MSELHFKSITASNKIKLLLKLKSLEVVAISKAARKLLNKSKLTSKQIYLSDIIISKKINSELKKLRSESKEKGIEFESIRVKNPVVGKEYSFKINMIDFQKEKFIECTLVEIKNSSNGIQKRKKKQSGTDKTLEKIIQIIDVAPFGAHIYKLNEKEELVFCGFNNAANKILGIEHSTLLDKKIQDAFPDLTKTEIPSFYKKVAKNGSQLENHLVDYEDQSMKGSFNVSAFQIEPGKVAAFFTDITEKKKAYLELEKSELKYKSLFDLANDAIFLMDEEIFIDCNRKTLELFDCKKEDIIGKPPYEYSPKLQPDGRLSKDKALEKITLAIKGEPQRFEWTHKKLDGELFDAEVSLNRIVFGDKILLQAIVRDITDRKKTEEQVSMLAHAVKSISESVCITDMEGNIIFVNSSFCKSYNYTYDEIIGQHISILRSEKNSNKILNQIIPETLQGGWNGEIINKRKDGDEFLTSTSTSVIRNDEAKPVALITVSMDISDRKQSENELRHSRQMLQLILDNIPQRIFWKDLNSNYLGCNKNFANDAGLSNPDEILSANDYDMPWKSAEADYYRLIDNEVMKNDKPIYHLIEPQTHIDGTIAWLETNKVPLHDENRKCGRHPRNL